MSDTEEHVWYDAKVEHGPASFEQNRTDFILLHLANKNCSVLFCSKEAGPCSTLASYQTCCEHNRRWLLTTGSDGRTLLTTPDIPAVLIFEHRLSTAWPVRHDWHYLVINNNFISSVWRCRHGEDPVTAHWIRDKLMATKTIFYVSYSVNFILYSLAGANYRNAVAAMCHPCCRTGGRFQPAVSRRTTPGAVRRLSGSTLGASSESGSAACAAINVEPRRIAVSTVWTSEWQKTWNVDCS